MSEVWPRKDLVSERDGRTSKGKWSIKESRESRADGKGSYAAMASWLSRSMTDRAGLFRETGRPLVRVPDTFREGRVRPLFSACGSCGWAWFDPLVDTSCDDARALSAA